MADRTYGRGDALNLTSVTDNLLAANSQTFGYSAANRLNAATGPYGSYSWGYDLVGNRTSEGKTPPGGSLSTDTYAYPATSNRIQTVTHFDGASDSPPGSRPEARNRRHGAHADRSLPPRRRGTTPATSWATTASPARRPTPTTSATGSAPPPSARWGTRIPMQWATGAVTDFDYQPAI